MPQYNYWPESEPVTLYGPTAPPPPPVVEEEKAERSQLQKAVTAAKNKDLTTLFAEKLRLAGVDPNDARVAALLEVVGELDVGDLEGSEALIDMMVMTAQEQVLGSSSYGQALMASGFASDSTQALKEAATWAQTTGGAPYTIPFEDREQIVYPYDEGKYVRHPDTGWWKFDGVLVDPTNQTVVYDPTKSAPGSSDWLMNARKTWSQESIQSWRKKLVQTGYLPKEFEKGSGWDVAFEEALRGYYEQKYLHGGEAVSYGIPQTQTDMLRIKDFSAQIRNDVRSQFVQVFGELPTDDELQYWTDFVVRTGMKLQRKKGMTGPEASAEAEHRMYEQVSYSPQAMLINQSVEENTELRDALLRAVSATWRLAT